MVLADDDIEPPVMVKVAQSRTTLFTENPNAGRFRIPRRKRAVPAASQHETVAAVFTSQIRGGSEEILGTQQILKTIAIQVSSIHRKHWRPLRLGRQGHSLESGTPIEKHHRRQFRGTDPRRRGHPLPLQDFWDRGLGKLGM